MAFFDRFRRRWAATGILTPPTDAQADTGFAFLGANTPTVELFNSLFQDLDAKDGWLYDALDPVFRAGGFVPAATNAAALLVALRALFSPAARGGSFGPSGSLGNTGTTAWQVPDNVAFVHARGVGGGGGGGGSTGSPSAGAGGGGGGYFEGVYAVEPGSVINVTAGAGGAGQPGTLAGGNGAASSFGTFASATGGRGGGGAAQGGYAPNNGAAGTSAGGNILNISGQAGNVGNAVGGIGWGGTGGSAYGSPGGAGTAGFAFSGIAGGGGGAGGANGVQGGDGGPGLVLVRF